MQGTEMEQTVRRLFTPVAEELERHAKILKGLNEIVQKQHEMLLHLCSFVKESYDAKV